MIPEYKDRITVALYKDDIDRLNARCRALNCSKSELIGSLLKYADMRNLGDMVKCYKDYDWSTHKEYWDKYFCDSIVSTDSEPRSRRNDNKRKL